APPLPALCAPPLGPAGTVLNVGAGAGSYEPEDRQVIWVEPSLEMIRELGPPTAPAIQGHAEDLPFDDDSFDASMAILTVHHWADQARGLKEMRRVTKGRVVLLPSAPSYRGAGLTDYFPELITLDEARMPKMSDYENALGPVRISPVPIPHDCTDGFLYAYWRRPGAHLDPRIRAGRSSFCAIRHAEAGLRRLPRAPGRGGSH